MKKFDVSVKSRGVVLFAFNTDELDYVKIAERTAQLIKKILDLPVTLITEAGTSAKYFDQIICVDNNLKNYKPGENRSWRNGDRWRAYELSPYDETILIDSDYLVLDRSLLKLFDQTVDYRIMTHNNTVDGHWPTSMGPGGLPYLWATVILFKKTERSHMMFDLVSRIQRNYLYYLRLYQIKGSNFRNDYAFTIANNILNGYELSIDQGVPWNMLTFNNVVKSIVLKHNLLYIKETDRAYVIPQQNIHVMDKEYLLSDNFGEFVEQICAN